MVDGVTGKIYLEEKRWSKASAVSNLSGQITKASLVIHTCNTGSYLEIPLVYITYIDTLPICIYLLHIIYAWIGLCVCAHMRNYYCE